MVSSGALVEGSNSILFYFKRPPDEHLKSGYRVVDLNFRISRDTDTPARQASNVLDEAVFVNDDPTDRNAPNWTVLHPGDGVTQGKDYWEKASLVDYPGGTTIQASCADCHAADGRDLKYFNYSNKSIIERSLFHGLDTARAERIASYIRSLDVPAPVQARPWTPPYQPGPGLDDEPTAWAAGAGLDWVLAKDEEMLPYLLPKGTDPSSIKDRVNIGGTLNVREMPVAIQFPDWNQWLPEVHPKDMFKSSYPYRNSALKKAYDDLRTDFTKQSAAARNANNTLVSQLTNFSVGVETFLNDVNNLIHPWTETDGNGNSPGLAKRKSRYSAEEYKLNLARWQATKHWEVIQEFNIESEVPNNRSGAEALQWPSENWVVFQMAPHIIGDNRGQSRMTGQPEALGYYLSTVWYQLQMTLNAGMKNGNQVETVDWAYNYQHILKANQYTGFLEPLRYFQNLIKGYQQRNSGRSITSGNEWVMREVSPWRLYAKGDGYQATHAALDRYEPGLRAKMTNALLQEFVDKVSSYEPGDWARSGRGPGSWWEIEASNLTPKDISGGDCMFLDGRPCLDSYDADEIDAMYTLLGKLQTMDGIDCRVVSDLARWCNSVWPGTNGVNASYWNAFVDGDCGVETDANNTLAEGAYYLQNKCSGLRMRYANGIATSNGTGAVLGTADGTADDYVWNINVVPNLRDHHFITNASNGREIRPDDCSQSAGALVETYDGSGNCVRWKLIPVRDSSGYYYLENRKATQSSGVVSMRIRNQGGATGKSTGTPIETLDNGTGECMQWRLIPVNGENNIQGANEKKSTILKTGLRVYPNPARHQVHIDGLTVEDRVLVTDLLGTVVYQAKGNRVLNVDHLPSGVYLVRTNEYVRRFVKE